MSELDRITLVDVGGLGGLGEEWLPHAERVRAVLFEPNPSEAAAARERLANFRDSLVIESALGDRSDRRALFVTKSLGCSSLMHPNTELLAGYSIRKAFDVTHEVEVDCVRFDQLRAGGQVPQPDAIKVDVQGFEYQVLEGFGESLNDVLAVKLEAHLYAVYHGQRLLHDLVALLGKFDLNLRRIEPVKHFDGDIVEVDAFFSCSPRRRADLDRAKRGRLEFIEQVWHIAPRVLSFGADQFG